MGFVEVPVKIFAPANSQEPAEIEMLVDTGAIYSVVPRTILEALGVSPEFKQPFETVDGRPIERDVGGMKIEVAGRRAPSQVPVVFGEPNDGAPLGVTALEVVGLKVNPVEGTLEPMTLRLWSSRREVDE